MRLFEPLPISKTKAQLACSEADALRNLEAAVEQMVKQGRWYPYYSKINQLRKPLLQLRLARRNKPKTT